MTDLLSRPSTVDGDDVVAGGVGAAGETEAGPVSLDELVGLSASDESDEGVRALVVGLHQARALLDAAVVEATGVLDRRGLHRADGARSPLAWIAARVGEKRVRLSAELK